MALARCLTILYGSQTGTAQDVAEKLYRDSKCCHFVGPVQALDGYDVRRLIGERFVVFVCSTQGQGDEPDNMRTFWRFLLRKSLPADSLCGLQYAVLGLGDTSYDKFNFVAKRLNKRLQQLGARPVLPTGVYFGGTATDGWRLHVGGCPGAQVWRTPSTIWASMRWRRRGRPTCGRAWRSCVRCPTASASCR